MSHESHAVVCYKLTKRGERSAGEVKVVFEKIDNKFYPINKKCFFCESEKIVITTNYEEIDNKYSTGELFNLETTGDSNTRECNYISVASKATKLAPREIIEVIKTKLPTSTNRKIRAFDYRPATKYIFIEDDFLYGPFEYEIEENLAGGYYLTLNTLAITLINKGVPNGYICKIKTEKDFLVDASINERTRKFILDIDELNNAEIESFDYRNDDLIIQQGNEILKRFGKESFTKTEIRNLKEEVLSIPDLSQFDEQTINRFFPLFDKMEEWKNIVNEMTQKYFESSQGNEYLVKYIDSHKDIYIESIKEEQEKRIELALKDLKEEESQLKERIEGLQKDRDSLANEVRAKKVEFETMKPDESAIAVSKEYKEKEKELETINASIVDLKSQCNELTTIIDLKSEINYLKRSKEEIRQEQTQLEDARKRLKAQVAGDEDEIKKKLLEYKTYIDIIYTARNDNPITKDYAIELCQKEKDNKLKARQNYIDYIHNFFLHHGRDYKKDEIVNLIVSIQQSFITVLAGLPGVGKTSLIQLLGKALKLNNRLLNISVARGWTSQRDLLGYFNPLNNSFQAAPTGFYELLQNTSKENSNIQAPIYVLLDEANLSPIEHYWSNFMMMTDDNNEKILHTGKYGEDAQLIIPEALRFIATINYDSTTEALSPRLIDRSPIIKLRPDRVIKNEGKLKPLDLDFLVYAHQELINLFESSTKNPELSEDKGELECFNKVIDILQDENTDYGQAIIVSQRKQIAIARYCDIARDNMIEEGNLRALDYAVSQHILPLINGSGEQYGKRLQKLLEQLNISKLKLSSAQLERIIKVGESEINTFNFFV